MIRIAIQAEQNSREIKCNDQVISIGRSKENEISLPEERELLDKHIKIVQTGNQGYLLLPQVSSAPGLLNGEPLKSHSLQSGDVFQVGKIKISFFIDQQSLPVIEEKEPQKTPSAKTAPSPGEKPPQSKKEKEEDTFVITSLNKVLKDPLLNKKDPREKDAPPLVSGSSEEMPPAPRDSSPTLFHKIKTQFLPRLGENLKKGKGWAWETARKNPKFVGLIGLAGSLVFFIVVLLLFKGLFFSAGEKKRILKNQAQKSGQTLSPAQQALKRKREILKQIERLGGLAPLERIRATKRLKKLLAQNLPEAKGLLEEASRRHPDPIVRWRALWVLETKDSPDIEDPLKKIFGE